MVFRLFVPSGEGQHDLVPKRPESLGATATLQYSVLCSTAAAAAYTSFATRYSRRVTPGCTLSRPALFIRSSAKLGLWAGVLGAAAEWYYNARVTSVVLSQQSEEVKLWKLYEKAREITVEDTCLTGAGLGLAISVPVFFMRRLAIPRWTRCAGLANAGACAGILGGHGYLQYTGERQKAYARLDQRLERRSVAFWALCCNRRAMSRLNPLVQMYVRHNALLYAKQLPDAASEQAEDYDSGDIESRDYNPDATSTESATVQYLSHYVPPSDYLKDLKRFHVQATREKIEEYEAEMAASLKEADFILNFAAHRGYEYCHLGDVDGEERRQRLEELQLLQITHGKLRRLAEQLETRIIVWRLAMQHKAIVESPAAATIPVSAWLPPSRHDFSTHDPALSIRELAKTQSTLDADITLFEETAAHPGLSQQIKERRRLDIEDARSLLRVSDRIIWEFEKMQDAARREAVYELSGSAGPVCTGEQKEKEKEKEKPKPIADSVVAQKDRAAGSSGGSLGVGKS